MRLYEPLTTGSGVYFEGTLIDSLKTAYQLIEIFDTPDLGKLMRIDGVNMTSERDEFFYHENLIHPAAMSHPAPKQVLIVGGGDGGACKEILKHAGIERVVLAELDAGVIDMAKKHLYAIHRGALDDERVDIRIGDGLEYVRQNTRRFDLIYLDLTDPIGIAEALYAPDFYADCKQALRKGGALVPHIGSPFSHSTRVHRSVSDLRTIFSKVAAYFVHIPSYGAVWGFACASDTWSLADMESAEIEARFAMRGVADCQYYNGAIHHAMQALPEYISKLIRYNPLSREHKL